MLCNWLQRRRTPQTPVPPTSTDHKTPSKMAGAGGSVNPSDIPDMEEIVLSWAKEMFSITKTKEQGRIDPLLLQYNINWKRVRFHFGEPEYEIVPFGRGGQPKGPTAPAMQPQVLFKTHFRNETAQEQEYSFKTERSTRSTATICVEKGFTRGAEFQLALKTPMEIAEANAGFKYEMQVHNIGEDTIEEELIWSVDNVVRVPPRTETAAELVITEAQHSGTFRMTTRFSGKVLVTVTNLRENNALVTVIEGNIRDILSRDQSCRGIFQFDGPVVVVQTRGSCNFKYGIEQRIVLTERPMSPNKYVPRYGAMS